MSAREDFIAPGPEQLRGLAHPTRMKMLGRLRTDGPQTATSLAQYLGINTGAASYHLRQLATHGFVVEDEERGTARERWWKAAHQATRVTDGTSDEAVLFIHAAVARQAQVLQESVDEFEELPPEWKRVTSHSDWGIQLTPERARALIDQIHELMWAALDSEEPEGDGTEKVSFQVHSFPLPGRIPHAGETP